MVSKNREPLLTTDYVVDETLTLLRARGERRKALEMGELFFESNEIVLYILDESDIRETWEIFRKFADKDWSFTDCASRYICEKFEIAQAVSFDRHFSQFGFVTVVP